MKKVWSPRVLFRILLLLQLEVIYCPCYNCFIHYFAFVSMEDLLFFPTFNSNFVVISYNFILVCIGNQALYHQEIYKHYILNLCFLLLSQSSTLLLIFPLMPWDSNLAIKHLCGTLYTKVFSIFSISIKFAMSSFVIS